MGILKEVKRQQSTFNSVLGIFNEILKPPILRKDLSLKRSISMSENIKLSGTPILTQLLL
jgi:hypothetical protein